MQGSMFVSIPGLYPLTPVALLASSGWDQNASTPCQMSPAGQIPSSLETLK